MWQKCQFDCLSLQCLIIISQGKWQFKCGVRRYIGGTLLRHRGTSSRLFPRIQCQTDTTWVSTNIARIADHMSTFLMGLPTHVMHLHGHEYGQRQNFPGKYLIDVGLYFSFSFCFVVFVFFALYSFKCFCLVCFLLFSNI